MDQSTGDHRAMFIDVEWESLLGQSIFKVPRPPARRLFTRMPIRALQTYARLLKKQLNKVHFLTKLRTVNKKVRTQGATRPADCTTLDKLDKIRTDAMIHAEKKCRKLRMGCVEFSPKVNTAYDTKQLCMATTVGTLPRSQTRPGKDQKTGIQVRHPEALQPH